MLKWPLARHRPGHYELCSCGGHGGRCSYRDPQRGRCSHHTQRRGLLEEWGAAGRADCKAPGRRQPGEHFLLCERFVGRQQNEVEEELKEVSYKVDFEGQKVKIDCPVLSKKFAPEEISAQVLRKLSGDAGQSPEGRRDWSGILQRLPASGHEGCGENCWVRRVENCQRAHCRIVGIWVGKGRQRDDSGVRPRWRDLRCLRVGGR